ncbi:hypothetical protein NHX12_022894, partial [Muraenolepis orangiensis]
MKRRWSLLPTITETQEDPATPLQVPTAGPPATPSADDYMASIQALARPPEVVHSRPVRLQRSARPRLFSRAQTKLPGAAALLRGSSRASRTGGPLSSPAPERTALRTMGDRDCKGRDPVDWLYGQAQDLMGPQAPALTETVQNQVRGVLAGLTVIAKKPNCDKVTVIVDLKNGRKVCLNPKAPLGKHLTKCWN